MLNNENNYIEDIISAGNDAFDNLYQLKFTNALNSDLNLTIRAQGINVPSPKQEPYTVRYMNEYVDFPKPQVNLQRNFTVVFRIDSNYESYKKLENQMNRVFRPSISKTITDVFEFDESDLFNVEIDVIKNQKSPYAGYPSGSKETLFKFERCWISQMTPPNFKTNSSDAMTTTLTINYMRMVDPHATYENEEDLIG